MVNQLKQNLQGVAKRERNDK